MRPGSVEPPPLRRGAGGGPQRATLLELFFDLVFVGALALTSLTLSREPTWSGAAKAILPLMAIWWIWTITALVTDFYDPQQRPIQVVLAGVMLGISQMAVATPNAFGKSGLVFAVSNVAIHLGRGVLLVSVLYRRERVAAQRAGRFLFWFSLTSVPWLIGGLSGERTRFILWGVALAVDYVSGGLRYPTPWIGRVPKEQYDQAGEHLGERYQQFMILALGDMILVAILGYSRVPRTGMHTLAALTAFVTTVVLWQIYVNRAGSILQMVTVRSPGRSARWAPYTHLTMVTGVITMAAGFDLVIPRPTGDTPLGWGGVIIGGPALFMIGRITFEYEVFDRWSWTRVFWLAFLIVAAPPVILFLPPLGVAAYAAAVLLGIAITDQLRVRSRASNATSHRQRPTNPE
ncbi:low temperature requirement protein A [Rugosimonospora africana]|uniref:Membrane protein n=1 Tax=Rugosimonospora africana TaxID=556532 RepID=A0A8J3QYZ4_9ACTN|nr:low temperature requirement protein A [Rugosimonospora africana]GIH18809.1 membrane protein [Rugosimonospora africana]